MARKRAPAGPAEEGDEQEGESPHGDEDARGTQSQAPPSKRSKRHREIKDTSWAKERFRARDPLGRYPVSGSIMGIHLINFMCHPNLQVKLGQQLNYLTGANGSGKSALATAISIVFGSRANQTNRAKSIKDFVLSNGPNDIKEAKIEIILCNQGDRPFEPETYGERISVERLIRKNSSTTEYVVTGVDGNSVRGAPAKKLVDALINHWNIQTWNPCTVMMQDQAKEFLQKSDPEALFKFYMHAMMFDDTREKYNRAQSSCDHARAQLKIREKMFPEMEEEVQKKQEVYERLRALEDIDRDILKLKHEIMWIQVGEEEQKLGRLQEEEKQADAALTSEDARLGQAEERRQLLEGTMAQTSAQLEALDAQYGGVQQQEAQADKRNRSAQAQLRSTQDQKKKLDAEVAKLGREVAKATMELDAARAKSSRDIEELRRKWREKVDQLEAAQRAKEQEVQELARAKVEADREVRQVQEERQACDEEAKKAADAERHAEAQIQTAQAAKSDRLDGLARHMSKLVRSIETARPGTFRGPVVGPVGRHVKLRDRQWATAVEACIGNSLRSFIVSNREDERTLLNLARQAQLHDNDISILMRRSGEAQYSRDKLAAFTPAEAARAVTVQRVLEVSHPAVFNALVDSARIESTWLFETPDDAEHVAYAGRADCAGAYTLDGTLLQLRGQTQVHRPYQSNRRGNFLADDWDALIAKAQQDKKEAAETKIHVQMRKGELDRRIQQATSVSRDAQHRLKAAEEQARRIRYEREDEERKEPQQEEDSVGELEDNLRMLEDRKAQAEESLRAKQDEIEGLKTEASVAAEAHRVAHAAKNELQERMTALMAAYNKAKDRLAKADSRRAEVEELVQAARQARDVAAQRVEAQERACASATEKAQAVCPREDVLIREGSTVESVDREIRKAEKRRAEEQQRRGGMSVEQAKEQYEEARAKLAAQRTTCDGAGKNLDELSLLLGQRQRRLRKMMETYAHYISNTFSDCMQLRPGCNGSVEIRHDSRELFIKPVLPGQQAQGESAARDLRTLSGGERSYSTTCFTLALGRLCESPFRLMDEFDVFMDAQNRELTMALLRQAPEKIEERPKQYIFLTPQEINAEVTNELFIQRITHPRLQANDRQRTMDDFVD